MKVSKHHAKRLLALTLSAIMALSPLLTGCSQQAAPTDAVDDEGKSIADGSEEDVHTIKVDYSSLGKYAVTITESDLIKLEVAEPESAPSDADEGKAIEDEAEADDSASNEPDNAEPTEATSEDDAATAETTNEESDIEALDKKYSEEGKEGYIYRGLSGDQPQWEPIEYTVVYTDELSESVDSEVATYEQALTLPKPDARKGHTFVGWATSEERPSEGDQTNPPYRVLPADTTFEHDLTCTLDADGEQVKLIDYANEDDEIKLYAQWDDEEGRADSEYTMVYGGELAKPIDSEVVTYETALTLPEPDAREGHAFVGWATSEEKPTEGVKTDPPYLVLPADTTFEHDLACAFDVDGDGNIDDGEEVKLADYANEDYEIKLFAQWDDSGKAKPAKFSDLTQDNVVVAYIFAPPAAEEEEGEPAFDLRQAQIDDFKNESGTIAISFTDPDAAANDTGLYYVLFDGLNSMAIVETNFADYQLTSETESVNCDSDSNTVVLNLSGDEFDEGISAKDITLDGSFKDMQVAGVSASGSTLTLELAGKPLLDADVSTTYTAGQITVAEEGFKVGEESETAYVDVDIPAASFDVSEIQTDTESVTMPLYVTGVDTKDVSPSDISFASGAKVTDVKADGDKLLITVATDNMDELAGQVKVKDREYLSPVTHASFDADLDYISDNDGTFEITLSLNAQDGTFANDLAVDKISLADDFADGSVTSVEVQDGTSAEVAISVPTNGKTIDDYDFVGTITFAEGALVDEWGGAAPEYSYATYYAANDEGKAAKDDSSEKEKTEEEKEEKKKEREEKRNKKNSDRAHMVVEYGNAALDKVGGNVAEVGKYCLDIFTIVAGAYTGNYGDIAAGLKNIILRSGLLAGGEDPNAPAAKTVEDKVDELKDLMSAMDQRMDVVEKNQYDMLVRGFDNALDALSTDCSRAESMLLGAKKIYEEQGKTAPSQGASEKELMAYNHALIDIIESQEKSGDRAFKNYSSLIARIENNYVLATTEAKKEWNYNPFHYYDRRVANYFNWETQGWYLRETYRSFAKFQITRAYSTLSLYYEIPQNAERYKDITERFVKSLQTIDGHPAGLAPADWKEGTPVYSNTLKRSVKKISLGDARNKDGFYVGDNEVNAYKARLHDKSVQEDLLLAFPSLANSGSQGNTSKLDATKDTGIGMGGKWTDSKLRARSNEAYYQWMKSYQAAPWWKKLFFYSSAAQPTPTKFVREKLYFERILFWNGDFKSVKTQDKGEKIQKDFLKLE